MISFRSRGEGPEVAGPATDNDMDDWLAGREMSAMGDGQQKLRRAAAGLKNE
jgi:hypothetical protein